MKSAFQLFKESFSELFSRIEFYTKLMAIPALFSAAMTFVQPETASNGAFALGTPQTLPIFIAVLLGYVLVSILATLALMYSLENKEASVSDAVSAGLRFFFRYVGVIILSTIAIIIGMLLLIVPGIWLSIALMFSGFFVVLRGEGVVSALRSSMQLVKGRWWKLFGKMLMFALLTFLVYIPVLVGFVLLSVFANYTVSIFAEAIFGTAMSTLAIIFAYLLFREFSGVSTVEVTPAENLVTQTPVPTV